MPRHPNSMYSLRGNKPSLSLFDHGRKLKKVVIEHVPHNSVLSSKAHDIGDGIIKWTNK